MRSLTAARLAAVVLLVTGLASCARTASTRPGQQPVNDATAAFNTRAPQVVKDWLASDRTDAWRHGFVPLQDLTVLPANPAFTEATKLAFLNGWYTFAAPALVPPVQPGQVVFADGTILGVPLQTSQQAYAQLAKAQPDCPAATALGAPAPGDSPTPVVPPALPSVGPPSAPGDVTSTSIETPCTVLRVTRAELGTVSLLTSRGEAKVPAWLFTVAGLPGKIARVAVAPASVAEMPHPDATAISVDGVTGAEGLNAVDGRAITYRIILGDCDTDVHPLFYETAEAVVLGASFTSSTGACDAMAVIKPVTVTLKAPLGSRTVLDVITGQPQAISRFPGS